MGGEPIQKMCGGVEALIPVGSQQGGLKKEEAHNIVDRAKNVLGLAVLGRGIRAGHAQNNHG